MNIILFILFSRKVYIQEIEFVYNRVDTMKCPDCRSKSITKYGHSRGKQRYICKKCQNTFTEFSYKNYPPTSIHPLFIAYILHNYKGEPLDLITNETNYLLQFFKSHNVSVGSKDKVSRSTVYKWINKYEAFADINKIQGRYVFAELLQQAFPRESEELPQPPDREIKKMQMEIPIIKGFDDHMDFLKYLQENLTKGGLDMLLKLNKDKFLINLNKLVQKQPITIKHEYPKYKWPKTTDGSKKKFPPKRKALN